jgi:hypothetical protein
MLKSNRPRTWSIVAASVFLHACGSCALAHVVANEAQPGLADAFEPFKDQLKFHWDDRWFYVESNGMPAHNMMVGITAWQQQVPLPKSYTGANAWQIPLHPVPAKTPVSIKGRFLRGAIAIAANGIPIFNPQNNRGEVSQEIGELDQWGGHCGRGDDYHYHAAPMFLEKTVGPGKPIAIALDGYPIYGSTGQDGLQVDEKTLDAFHGKTDARGNYAYFASAKYPFVNGGFHGEVVERGGQVDPQPSGQGVRPAMPPLRGAHITDFTRSKDDKSFSLKYELAGETRLVNYTINADDSVKFDFIDGRGQIRTESYSLRSGAGRAAGADRAAQGNKQNAPAPKQPVDVPVRQPFTDNHNGTVTDNFTGLIWQQVDNGESTWEKAAANASTLRLAGYDDWRLPTLPEAFSLANHSSNPAIDLNFFPSNPTHAAGYWWTSDTRGPDRVWVVNRGGGTGAKPKKETLSAGGEFSYNARYVRGAKRPDAHNYVNNEDGTITDSDSGLMWAQVPAASMTWDAALAYTKGLAVAGHMDWRLPDVKELATLIDFATLNSPASGSGVPCINRTFFPDAKATFYWSLTKLHSRDAAEAWYVDFASGSVRYQTFSSKNPVFAVRTAAPVASLTVGANSYFHPEDAPGEQAAVGREGDGSVAGKPNSPRGDFHLLPRNEEEKLNLTTEQRKQIEDLATETKNKLEKILTPEQMKALESSRPPRRD